MRTIGALGVVSSQAREALHTTHSKCSAMFTLPPPSWNDQQPSAAGSRERSRTPSSTGAPPWATGNQVCDEWFSRQGVAAEVVQNFAMLPRDKRKGIVLGMMEKMPDNIDAWLNGCWKRWRQDDLERRLTGQATPQRPREAGPAIVAMGAVQAQHRQPASVPTASLALPSAPTAECVALAKHWPADKSTLIGELMGYLDESCVDKYLEHDTADQAALAFAFMLTAPEQSEQWGTHMNSLIDCFARLRREEDRPAPSPRASPPESGTIHVQFVLAGFSDVMAVTLMTVLQIAIAQMHPRISWSFHPVLLMRDATTKKEDIIPTERLNEARLIIESGSSSFEDLANNFRTLSETWNASGTKFIFVANVACLPSADSTIEDIPKHYLHQAANKWTWMCLQASLTTRQHFRNDAVADVIFAPPTEVLRDELNQMWGEETQLKEPIPEVISPIIPRVHSTPAKFGVAACLQASGHFDSPIGKESPPDLKTLIRAQPTFRVRPSLVAKLLVTRTFRERSLSREEVQLLDKCQTDCAGVVRHASRAFFLQWFGLRDTIAESILDTKYPCFQFVNRSTGSALPQTSRFASPCGQERYCKHCEQVFRMLDTGYGLQTYGDVILALITKALPTWTGAFPSVSDWERKANACKPHECGADCTGLP